MIVVTLPLLDVYIENLGVKATKLVQNLYIVECPLMTFPHFRQRYVLRSKVVLGMDPASKNTETGSYKRSYAC